MTRRNVLHADKDSHVSTFILTAYPYLLTAPNLVRGAGLVPIRLERARNVTPMTKDGLDWIQQRRFPLFCNVMPFHRYERWEKAFSEFCLPRNAKDDPQIKRFQRKYMVDLSGYAPCLHLLTRASEQGCPPYVAVFTPLEHQVLLQDANFRNAILKALGMARAVRTDAWHTPTSYEIIAMALIAFDGGLADRRGNSVEISEGRDSICGQVRRALNEIRKAPLSSQKRFEELYKNFAFSCRERLSADWVERARAIRYTDPELAAADDDREADKWVNYYQSPVAWGAPLPEHLFLKRGGGGDRPFTWRSTWRRVS